MWWNKTCMSSENQLRWIQNFTGALIFIINPVNTRLISNKPQLEFHSVWKDMLTIFPCFQGKLCFGRHLLSGPEVSADTAQCGFWVFQPVEWGWRISGSAAGSFYYHCLWNTGLFCFLICEEITAKGERKQDWAINQILQENTFCFMFSWKRNGRTGFSCVIRPKKCIFFLRQTRYII